MTGARPYAETAVRKPDPRVRTVVHVVQMRAEDVRAGDVVLIQQAWREVTEVSMLSPTHLALVWDPRSAAPARAKYELMDVQLTERIRPYPEYVDYELPLGDDVCLSCEGEGELYGSTCMDCGGEG